MPIRKIDIIDADFADAAELASDGYSLYLTTTLVSTNSGTKLVTINLPADGEGLITGYDHPAESGDRVRLTGTTGGADGYYTINAVLSETTFSVLETISSSTGGSVDFMWPSGASKIGFDPTGATHTSSTNLQQVLKDFDASITSSSGFTATKIEVDFGSIPTNFKTFVITDAAVTASSRLVITQSGEAATGRSADENEMDPIMFTGTPQSGQFILIATTLNGPVVGKYKVNYSIG